MPRILEALERSLIPPAVGAEGSGAARAGIREEAVASAAHEAAAGIVPFIEVGGASLLGSPDVLSAPARKLSSKPILKLPVEPVSGKAAISFLPLPGGPKASGELAAELVAFHDPAHPLNRQYRTVLDHMLATARAGNARVLCLSGLSAGVGTTTVLLNLAFLQARESKQQVLVVDAGIHRPALAIKLGLPAGPGLREVLTGVIPLSRAVQASAAVNLHAVTIGEEGERPSLAVRSLGAALQQLRKRFDLVLVDAPTWHGGADMLALAAACDALFLVVPHNQSGTPETTRLMQALSRQGVHLRGCILTQAA